MSLEDSKYLWVKVEPPWESTGLHMEIEQSESAQANIKHVVMPENELKSKDACDITVAAQACLYLNEVKVEFELESKEGSSNASTEALGLLEVKAESEGDSACGVSDTTLYLKHKLKAKSEIKEALYTTNEVKTEAEWESDGPCGVSNAAALASLYLKHEVKDELVVGPEVFQGPKVLAAWSESLNTAEESVLNRTCSVKLERMDVDMECQVCRIGESTYNFKLYGQEYDAGKNKFKREIQCEDESEPASFSFENTLSDMLEEKLYKCTYCSFSSVYKKYIRVHKNIAHVGEKPHKCNECEYTTYTKNALKAHTNTEHASIYKCDQCSYSSIHRNGLKIHKLVHKREKPFRCDQCNYSCSRKNNLTHHKWVHSKEKPFKCEYCDYANARKYELQAHINAMHCSDHVHRCEQCNYATVRKDKMQAHKRMHSFASSSKDYSHVLTDTKNKYKCDLCSYDSVREDLLQIHKNMMHANGLGFEAKKPLASKPRRSSKKVKTKEKL